MNPALSSQITACLPICSAKTRICSTTSSSVTTVRTISTKSCTGAGLKKCNPTTRDGWLTAVEISVTDSDEVLVHQMTRSGKRPSSWPSTWRFNSRFSGTASITMSDVKHSCRLVVKRMRSRIPDRSLAVSLSRATARSVDASMR